MSRTNLYIRTSVFVFIVTVVLLFAHSVIYFALVTMWEISSAGLLLGLKIIFAALPISFIGISIVGGFYKNIFVRISYIAMSVWLGFFVYLFIASNIYGLILGITQAAGLTTLLEVYGTALVVSSIIVGIYGLSHARRIYIKDIRISLPDLPPRWKDIRAVFISDIHLGHIRGAAFAERIVARVNAINPDVVFIGGDLYDGVKVDEDAIIAPFAKMKPPLGTYFITGNHEEFSDNAHLLDAIRRLGIRVLTNEMVEIEGLQLVGVTDQDSIDKERFRQILDSSRIDHAKPVILLKHQPTQLDIAEAAGVDLQLSGHTHRAQMWPLNLFTYLIYRTYDYGLKRFGAMQVYTGSGVGTWGPPVRVGSRGEIVVMTFGS